MDGEKFAALKASFSEALDNDLNTSLAVTALYDVLKADTNGATKLAAIRSFDEVLALDLVKEAAPAEAEETDPEAQEIEALIAARAAAKKERNFAEADRIRNLLTERGITLIDTKEGTTWKRG